MFVAPTSASTSRAVIRMYIIHGALASFEESFKGSLEVSKPAALVVLVGDLSRVPVEQLRHVEWR